MGRLGGWPSGAWQHLRERSPARCRSLGFSGAAAGRDRSGALGLAARAASGRSVLAVWPWASGKGPSRGHPAGAARGCEARWAGRVGGRLWGQLGESRGSGQASWPYPPVSCPHPAAQAPLPRGICHLLERKERKSKGSSLCRHLETQLDFLRTVGRGDSGRRGQGRASKPTSGVAQSKCPHALSPAGGSRGRGLGCPAAPRERRPRRLSVCECARVRVCAWAGGAAVAAVQCIAGGGTS